MTIEVDPRESWLHMLPYPSSDVFVVGWLVTLTETEGVSARFVSTDVVVTDAKMGTVLLTDSASAEIVAQRWYRPFDPYLPARGTLRFLYRSPLGAMTEDADYRALRVHVTVTVIDESGHTVTAASDFSLSLTA